MGTVDLWLASKGFSIGTDVTEGIRSKLKEPHPPALYSGPSRGFDLRLAFIDTDGTQRPVSKVNAFKFGAPLITLDESAWLKKLGGPSTGKTLRLGLPG